MTLSSCTPRAGGEPTDTPAPFDGSCLADNCAVCDAQGCVTCDAGFYAFLRYGTLQLSDCFECQQLNCAPRGCSDGIGASPDLTTCA